ncbi:MAG TPA: hypothetical protein VM778_13455 [Gemmatimonadota bacterium]|nr:hypothetical protein [Gemmatimonadota bacterium]
MSRRMVVLRTDGTRLRGYSLDFVPGKPAFHFQEVDESGEVASTHTLPVEDVHAVFFVRDFGFERGRRYTAEDAPHDLPDPPTSGSKKLKVTCVWGEVIEGLTYAYEPDRPGFFLFPTAPEERAYNLERAYFTPHAVAGVELSPAA